MCFLIGNELCLWILIRNDYGGEKNGKDECRNRVNKNIIKLIQLIILLQRLLEIPK